MAVQSGTEELFLFGEARDVVESGVSRHQAEIRAPTTDGRHVSIRGKVSQHMTGGSQEGGLTGGSFKGAGKSGK